MCKFTVKWISVLRRTTWFYSKFCCKNQLPLAVGRSEADGEELYEWDADADDSEFEGMRGDEVVGDGDDEAVDEEEADRQDEEAAKVPFQPDDFSTPGEGFEVLPCPTKLPHDLQVGQQMAQWFGPPFNAWHVDKIVEINKRRTVSENVSVQFIDEKYGDTLSLIHI